MNKFEQYGILPEATLMIYAKAMENDIKTEEIMSVQSPLRNVIVRFSETQQLGGSLVITILTRDKRNILAKIDLGKYAVNNHKVISTKGLIAKDNCEKKVVTTKGLIAKDICAKLEAKNMLVKIDPNYMLSMLNRNRETFFSIQQLFLGTI